jgi:tRNA threonylcarbamoyladenosine biosynthesis protein TsaB
MKILAVEFSTAQRSVAIWDASPNSGGASSREPQISSAVLLSTVIEPPPPPKVPRTPFSSQRSLSLVAEALQKANCAKEEIEVIAVGLGPGSYTGIRGGIALAQGWQLGRGINVLGISTAECLAAQAHAAGRRGQVNVVIDAQRNEFYLAGYEITADGCREADPMRLAAPAEIHALAKAGQTLHGPEIATWFAGAEEVYPEAAMLGRLACGRRDFVSGEKLEPIYLRETSFKKAPPPRVASSNP